MQKRDINATLAPKPASAYSQAIEVTGCTRILFISGQVGTDDYPRLRRNPSQPPRR